MNYLFTAGIHNNLQILLFFLFIGSSFPQGHIDFLEENNKDAICYYLFSLVSEEVCGIEPGQLSAGDIILIM